MESEPQLGPIQPRRSTFINVLAWLFIVIGGFSTFVSILQNIMVRMMFHSDEANQAFRQAESAKEIPAFAGFIFNHMDLFFLSFLVVSASSLVSAIALLKRKNWARVVFIVLMALGIVWNIAGVVLQFTMFNNMPEFANRGAPPEFQSMMRIMQGATVIMVIAFTALFCWIIKKLVSPQIRAEFN
jgi:hypothetical protein